MLLQFIIFFFQKENKKKKISNFEKKKKKKNIPIWQLGRSFGGKIEINLKQAIYQLRKKIFWHFLKCVKITVIFSFFSFRLFSIWRVIDWEESSKIPKHILIIHKENAYEIRFRYKLSSYELRSNLNSLPNLLNPRRRRRKVKGLQ